MVQETSVLTCMDPTKIECCNRTKTSTKVVYRRHTLEATNDGVLYYPIVHNSEMDKTKVA